MKLREDDKIILDEFDTAVAVLTDECSAEQKAEILAGSEMLIAGRNFIEGVKSGKMKPKSTCDEFERILDKYNIQIVV